MARYLSLKRGMCHLVICQQKDICVFGRIHGIQLEETYEAFELALLTWGEEEKRHIRVWFCEDLGKEGRLHDTTCERYARFFFFTVVISFVSFVCLALVFYHLSDYVSFR